jgi:hypothetical protein
MLTTKEGRPAIRTLRGWAIAVLSYAHAIQECEEHSWMQDRADPHARERAFAIARRRPAFLLRPPPSQSQKCSIRSATPVRSALLGIDGSQTCLFSCLGAT